MTGKGRKIPKQDFFQVRKESRDDTVENALGEDPLPEILRGQRQLLESMAGLKEEVHAMGATVGALDDRIKKLEENNAMVGKQHASLASKMVSMESNMEQLQGKVTHHQTFIPVAADTMVELQSRLEILENARRAHMIRVVGFPAAVDSACLCKEVSGVIEELFQCGGEKCPVGVLKATRLPSGRRAESEHDIGATVLVTLGDSDQRDVVLRKAAVAKKVMYNGRRVLLFPDVAPATQERRKRLLEIRKDLVKLGLSASLWHPAKLRVIRDNKVFVFTKVDAAEKFLASAMVKPVPTPDACSGVN